MPIVQSSGGSEFELAPEGTHTGRCYKLLDLGTQQGEWQGMPTYPARQVYLQWELPDELTKDGKPYTVGQFVKLAAGDKSTLTKITQACLGEKSSKGFDANKLVGASCNLSIVHEQKADGSTKAKITGYVQLKKSEKKPVPINDDFIFDLDAFDQAKFDSLSDFFKGSIMKSPEYAELKSGAGSYAAAKAGKAPDKRSEHVGYEDSEINDAIPF